MGQIRPFLREGQGIGKYSLEERARRVRRLVENKDLGLDSPGFSPGFTPASVTYQRKDPSEIVCGKHLAWGMWHPPVDEGKEKRAGTDDSRRAFGDNSSVLWGTQGRQQLWKCPRIGHRVLPGPGEVGCEQLNDFCVESGT